MIVPISMQKQSGSTLILLAVVLILVLTTIITTASRSTLLEVRMTSNYIDKKIAFNAANAAILEAVNMMNTELDFSQFVGDQQFDGFYDLRRVTLVSSKQLTDWGAVLNKTTLDQESALKVVDSTYGLSTQQDYLLGTDVFDFSAKPRFAIGVHDPSWLVGTEGVHCIPVSIIGVGNGRSGSSLSMIEMKMLPKSGCFRNRVK